jgi:hypothetical protein
MDVFALSERESRLEHFHSLVRIKIHVVLMREVQ